MSDSFAVAFNHLVLNGEVEYLFLVAVNGFVNVEKENLTFYTLFTINE